MSELNILIAGAACPAKTTLYEALVAAISAAPCIWIEDCTEMQAEIVG